MFRYGVKNSYKPRRKPLLSSLRKDINERGGTHDFGTQAISSPNDLTFRTYEGPIS